LKPHIILTRPLAQAQRFGASLTETLGDAAVVIESPLLQINPVEFGDVPDKGDVIFTSENGVDLSAIGIPVQEVLVYTQDPLALSEEAKELVQGAGRVIFPLFSSRSMGLLVEQGIGGGHSDIHAVCISKGVAKVAPEGCFASVIVCDAPNSRSMKKKLMSLVA